MASTGRHGGQFHSSMPLLLADWIGTTRHKSTGCTAAASFLNSLFLPQRQRRAVCLVDQLSGQFGAFLVQASLKGAPSDLHPELHLLTRLFHVIEGHAHGVVTVDGRRYRVVRLILEMEYQPERAVGRLDRAFPISFEFLRHRRAS